MRIKYLDGTRLYRAFLAGGNAVISDQIYLNKINVFPVPDSDTGTNLASTMRSIAETAVPSRSIKTTLQSIADAALVGARGNSGLIFAQFVYGISNELRNEVKISTKAFGEYVKRAVRYAYQSLVSPVEGTMITLIHDWAEAVYEHRQKTSDFAELLSHSLPIARESLKETPKKLSVLAKAGVVDAGAKGFVDFLEGVVHFITKGNIKAISRFNASLRDTLVAVHAQRSSIRERYCSEALLLGKNLDLESIRKQIQQYGNSAIVAGSAEKARIHIHTDHPAELFFKLKNYGSIAQIKADDMVRQYEASHSRKSNVALVSDSSCDLPPEVIDDFQIHLIPQHVHFGESLFLDKVTITPDQFYTLLKTQKNSPKSSQTSLATIEDLFSFLACHYESILVVTISDKLTGTFNLCQKAAEKIVDKKIAVHNSRHISVSLGLIVMRMAEALREGKSYEEIACLVQDWISKTKLLVDINTLKYLVRGGRVSPLRGLLAKLLNLKPIITLDSEGKTMNFGKSFSRRGNMKKILEIIRKSAEERKLWKYAIVHAQNPRRAQRYAEELSRILGQNPAYIMDVSPVIGVHTGIGAIGIAFMSE